MQSFFSDKLNSTAPFSQAEPLGTEKSERGEGATNLRIRTERKTLTC